MKKKTVFVAVSIFLICVLVYLGAKLVIPHVFNYFSGYDQEYIQKMKSITVGMTEQEVIKILGQPGQIITEREVKLTHGKYGSGKEYGKAIQNINRCLIYYHGVDYIGSYFVDNEGKVYFVNVGGT